MATLKCVRCKISYTCINMSNVGQTEIKQAISLSGIKGFTGNYRELGGGEINNSFLLTLETEDVVLRISKYSDQDSLKREAKALSLLDLDRVPKLIYFDHEKKINGKQWIIESYITGAPIIRPTQGQFKSLGTLLAKVHTVRSPENTPLNLWGLFLESCSAFGSEELLRNHPDEQLRRLVNKAYRVFSELQPRFTDMRMSLIHGDATPSNMLANGDQVSLIDWELSRFNDPMAEFSTIFYEDIEYNRGKWRLMITPEEKVQLFAGYNEAGGAVDEERVRFWINFDKLGASIFLYWRLHDSGREANSDQISQYELDYRNLIASLEKNL